MARYRMVLHYTDGRRVAVSTPREAYRLIRADYPRAVCYDAGGFRRSLRDGISAYDARTGRVALYWATVAQSRSDDGARAVAQLRVCG